MRTISESRDDNRTLLICLRIEKQTLMVAAMCWLSQDHVQSGYTDAIPSCIDVVGILCRHQAEEFQTTLVLQGFSCSQLAMVHAVTSSKQLEIRS